MVTVYILWSEENKRTYVGMSTHLEERLKEHNAGYNKSTKAYRPWKIIHTEVFSDFNSARKREKYFKSGVGRESIRHNLEIWLRGATE